MLPSQISNLGHGIAHLPTDSVSPPFSIAPRRSGRLATTSSLHALRVLVVSNFAPVPEAPQRGRWVRDQVEGIRALGVEVDLFEFEAGRANYPPAVTEARRRLRAGRFDLVHAHYGLAGWVAALAGASPLVVTFHGTDVRHPVVGPLSRMLTRRLRLTAGVSRALFELEGSRPGLKWRNGAAAVLPCGPDLDRFGPIDRDEARRRLGLPPDSRLIFFPANPNRPEKRHDRAVALASACNARLITGGSIEPDQMPLWMNAADAVVVTSEYEGFGLACVEALACDVPVLSTDVGIAPFALAGIEGCLAAPFELPRWQAAIEPHLAGPPSRIEGARSASRFAAGLMADRVVHAYEDILGQNPDLGR